MDRAHRLGQTKQVTVYRLITKGTIDERIVQLARAKKNVQEAVVGSSTQATSAEVARPAEVVSLLLSQEEMEESLRNQEAKRRRLEEQKIEDGKRGARIRFV
jgi:DNA helicase INO80